MDQEAIWQLFDESPANGIADPFAGINQLIAFLPVILILSVVVVVIIGVFAVISTVSRIRSQTATVAMQKDIKEIRKLLEEKMSGTRQPLAQLAAQTPPPSTEKGDLL